MLKRRNIREAAIQFLYLADLEDGPEAADMEDAFWQMIQESSILQKPRPFSMLRRGEMGA